MPPKVQKQKSASKDGDKSKVKKSSAVDDTNSMETPLINDEQQVPTTTTPTVDLIAEEIKTEETPCLEEVDLKYEEPVLTLIIVESYEGEKFKGCFEGFGKALFRGGHRYEGDFHNGMMSGKGMYIWSNGIIYEGDFLNNEIVGTGKYLWPSNQHRYSTYEGEVLKGKRHGLGTFRSGLTPNIYVGEWVCGKRYGKGKMVYDSEGTSFFEGDWIDNRKFGWGVRHYPSGNMYEGMWVNDVRHGEGTMRWFDKNQTYTGQWENGIQNGTGEHNWFLGRVESTQYTLRNTYYGNFLNGKRHGQGTFLYANGAKYIGAWKNNLKHGLGKYIYKDGHIYEGYFEDDKMTDSPTYNRTSKFSEQIAKINTRLPSAGTTLNLNMLRENGKANRVEFDLNLDMSSILCNFEKPEERNLELNQAQKTIIRYLDLFKQIYRFYSQLGMDMSPDNTYVLNRMQFWRYLKDCNVHLNDQKLTLMEFDRLLNKEMRTDDVHCPFNKILLREFLNYNVLIAYYLYKDEFKDGDLLVSWCIKKLIEDNILKFSCNVRGDFYMNTRKTLNLLPYMVKSYDIYRRVCKNKKDSPFDPSITMRGFINVMNDFKLVDRKNLTTKNLIEILASDNQLVYDFENSYYLDFEITFLEFFEALIGCALVSQRDLHLETATDELHTEGATNNNNEPATVRTDRTEVTTEIPSDSFIEKRQLNVSRPLPSAKNEIQQDYKKELKREDTRVSFFENLTIKNENDESYPNTHRPSTGTDVNLLVDGEKDYMLDEAQEQEYRRWIEKNEVFFSTKLFPAAEKYLKITELVNKSL